VINETTFYLDQASAFSSYTIFFFQKHKLIEQIEEKLFDSDYYVVLTLEAKLIKVIRTELPSLQNPNHDTIKRGKPYIIPTRVMLKYVIITRPTVLNIANVRIVERQAIMRDAARTLKKKLRQK
jgi:hypothetical protein